MESGSCQGFKPAHGTLDICSGYREYCPEAFAIHSFRNDDMGPEIPRVDAQCGGKSSAR